MGNDFNLINVQAWDKSCHPKQSLGLVHFVYAMHFDDA